MSTPAFLDMQQLADRYGLSKEWVRVRVKQRAIPFSRVPGGRLVRFSADDVRAIDAMFTPEPVLNGPPASRAVAA
ncbi:DNA-binding protein [Verrucosispora sp. SN26_14.1]|uniref:helix-turn-helix transcriptional regulator n=1 Tax=Verrucosispora sp. SN26_14.1 TaxID=2527879 RepID=UPI0010346BED|nr:helix-turn-helix domain-containing protein [Verrucosispora sp. SN26_14.1]TBL29075.1 DNA-binding protein [Verrucosispora sp. SN26_14.1]